MNISLPEELRGFVTEQVQVNQSHDQQLLATDPATNRQYVLVDAERHERFEAVEAIQNGFDQMQRGEGQDLHEAMDDIRKELSRRF